MIEKLMIAAWKAVFTVLNNIHWVMVAFVTVAVVAKVMGG